MNLHAATQDPGRNHSSGLLRLAAVAVGITSIATQIIFLRELLSVFYGNELILGGALAAWMGLTGAGAAAARFTLRRGPSDSIPPGALIALSVLPALTVFALRFLRNRLFIAGSMIGVAQALVSSFILLAPFCLTSGFLFALLAVTASRRDNLVGTMYALESAGSLVGALVFNILLVAWLNALQAAGVLMILDLGIAFLLARRERKKTVLLACGVLLAAGVALVADPGIDLRTRAWLFPAQDILAVRDTPYGNLTVTRQAGQLTIYENSQILSSTDNPAAEEESVHYALVQRPHAKRVLLIGGGMVGTIREVLKYDCQRIDYVESDPWVIDAERTFIARPEDARVRIVNDDARRYVAGTTERYDAVLVNLPDPATAQVNRFFTREFFLRVRSILNPGGILATSLLAAAEYQGHEARLAGSVLLSTLRNVFPVVAIIPGDRNFFLASDSAIDVRVAALVDRYGIPTQYVNRYYLDDTQVEQRSRELTVALNGGGTENTDMRPVSYARQTEYWLSYFGFSGRWLFAAVAVFWTVLFISLAPVNAGVFAAGTSAASAQVLLMVAFQTLCGSLYQMTGFLVAAFMAGLAIGAGPLAGRLAVTGGRQVFIVAQSALAVCGFLLWPLITRLHGAELPLPVLDLVFLASAMAIAVLVGLVFSSGSRLPGRGATRGATELYGLDLLGSALGALAISVSVLPEFGIAGVSTLAGAVALAGAIRCLIDRRRQAVIV